MTCDIEPRKSYQVGDGQTSFYEPTPTYGESILPTLQNLLSAYDKLANTIWQLDEKGFLKDEKAEARKRSHDDLIKKHKNLYKRGK